MRFCWAPRTSSPSYRSTVSSVGLWTIRSLTLAPPGSSLIVTPRPHASANATYSIDGAAAAISGKTASGPTTSGSATVIGAASRSARVGGVVSARVIGLLCDSWHESESARATRVRHLTTRRTGELRSRGEMASKDTNTGAKRARETRSELGLSAEEPMGCLLTLVERRLELPVVIAALPQPIAGCCWHDGARIVLWVNGTHAAVRQRFTLAHELGHLRCRHDARIEVDTFETLAGKTTDSREIQANAFAAELLAPAAGVRAMVDGEPTLDDVVLIAARFGISTIAALYRLNTLGLTGPLREAQAGDRRRAARGRVGPALARAGRPISSPRSTARRCRASPPPWPARRWTAMIAGTASVDDAAAAADCDPDQLASGAAAIGA